MVVHEGKVASLRHKKDIVKEIVAGSDCGILLEVQILSEMVYVVSERAPAIYASAYHYIPTTTTTHTRATHTNVHTRAHTHEHA